MKDYTKFFISWIILLVLATSCKKDKVKPIDKLPPATQEGKNTFGCLVSGEAWAPKGNNGTRNLFIRYNPGIHNGLFDLSAYRILPDKTSESFYLFIGNFNNMKRFTLNDPKTTGTILLDYKDCYFDRDSSVYRKGELLITKFDIANHIIAGTFEATLAKPGCDTVKITEGRFDMKF